MEITTVVEQNLRALLISQAAWVCIGLWKKNVVIPTSSWEGFLPEVTNVCPHAELCLVLVSHNRYVYLLESTYPIHKQQSLLFIL